MISSSVPQSFRWPSSACGGRLPDTQGGRRLPSFLEAQRHLMRHGSTHAVTEQHQPMPRQLAERVGYVVREGFEPGREGITEPVLAARVPDGEHADVRRQSQRPGAVCVRPSTGMRKTDELRPTPVVVAEAA